MSTLQPIALAADVLERHAVTRLMLTDFRCYAALRLETDGRPVVLTGPNGAGKTNLLEAISFLVPGRGLRRARLGDVTRRNGAGAASDGWAVAATVGTGEGVVDIGTGLRPGCAPGTGSDGVSSRRAVRIDGMEMRGQTALGDKVAALWLTPDMERLFSDGPAGRRRFLDRLVFALDAAHSGRLAAFQRALRERARLLRDGVHAGAAPDREWLAALEATMVEKGVAIVAARSALVERLNAASRAAPGPFPAAGLASAGVVEDWLAKMPALAAEDCFRDALAAGRAHDADAGGAAVGPHLSDFRVTHLAKGIAAERCSTGEQKALLVSIVLANARLRMLDRSAVPLLLMDEVAAHLDETRRAALFEEILALGAQAWMTGTDEALFSPLGGQAQFFRVENARVRRSDNGYRTV